MSSILVRCVAGPDAGWSQRLLTGSHWIGRAPGGVHIADPAMEPHLARVDVAPDGSITVLQATGRAPVLVEGTPAHGPVRITDGTTLEFAGTRLEFGSVEDGSCALVGWVYEPQDASAVELARFERDVGLAAAASRRRLLAANATGTVELGVAVISVPVEIRGADGAERATGALSHAAQAVLDRACALPMPVRITLEADQTVGVVAPDPEPVVAAILAQLDSAARALVIVADADEAADLVTARRPILVTTAVASGLPPCDSLLEVGSTWRATWQPDLREHPDEIIRLHARGKVPRR